MLKSEGSRQLLMTGLQDPLNLESNLTEDEVAIR
jgi:hypothetical protein